MHLAAFIERTRSMTRLCLAAGWMACTTAVFAAAATPSPLPAQAVPLSPWQPPAASTAPEGLRAIAATRTSPATTSFAQLQQLPWKVQADGSWAAALQWHASGAYGLRLGLRIDALPLGTQLRIYHPQQPEASYDIAGQQVLQQLEHNWRSGDHSEAAHTWWSPDSAGDRIALEIRLPASSHPSQLRMAVPKLLHIYEDLLALDAAEAAAAMAPPPGAQAAAGNSNGNASGTDTKPSVVMHRKNAATDCTTDVNCYAAQLERESRAVARLSLVRDGMGYLCTGTLLATQPASGQPYLLTANHCVDSQTVASSLITYWFYRSNSCNDTSLSSQYRVQRSGATLLFGASDISLLRLHEQPPEGVAFADWSSALLPLQAEVYSLHHALGGVQQAAAGTHTDYMACEMQPSSQTSWCTRQNAATSNAYDVRWSTGSTQGGSSGAALWHRGEVYGVLSAGQSQCTAQGNRSQSQYIQLSSVLPMVQEWLAPQRNNNQVDLLDMVPRQAIYRFYDGQNQTHFFTSSDSERDHVQRNFAHMRYEGIAFYAHTQPAPERVAVYRFFNTRTLAHFYTADAQELDYVRRELPFLREEGIAWYGYGRPASNRLPLYRFFNTQTATHFYSTSESERAEILNHAAHLRPEGSAYYVWATP